MQVSIILPTYNERDNIGNLITALADGLTLQGWESEIIVVDDNSPDGTAQVVQSTQTSPPVSVRCLVRTKERGLATAIRYGIENGQGEWLVVMDTDFNHDPALIPNMLRMLDDVDIVIGSRFIGRGGMEDRTRHYLSWLYNLVIIRPLLWTSVHDSLSGFFAARRSVMEDMNLEYIFRGYGEYFIRMLYAAKLKGCTMREVPVYYKLRQHGSSKSDFKSMLINYTGCVLATRLNPSKLKRETKI